MTTERTSMETAEADTIQLRQGGISVATATAIDVRQGGIGRARATDIAVSQGGIGLAQGERVSLEMGSIGAGRRRRGARSPSRSRRVVAAAMATVDQSLVRTVVAGSVTFRQPSAVLLLVAGRVDGSVRPLLDWRSGLAAGVGAAAVLSLARLVRQVRR